MSMYDKNHYNIIKVINFQLIKMNETKRKKSDRSWVNQCANRSIWGHGHLLQFSCLENPYGQRSLVGYSLYGHKGLDTTEVT